MATDLRMMSARQFIWTIPRTHGSSPVTALAQWGHTADGTLQLPPLQGPAPAGHPHPHLHQQQQASEAKMCNLLVSGGKDGSLALVDISAGKVGRRAALARPLGAETLACRLTACSGACWHPALKRACTLQARALMCCLHRAHLHVGDTHPYGLHVSFTMPSDPSPHVSKAGTSTHLTACPVGPLACPHARAGGVLPVPGAQLHAHWAARPAGGGGGKCIGRRAPGGPGDCTADASTTSFWGGRGRSCMPRRRRRCYLRVRRGGAVPPVFALAAARWEWWRMVKFGALKQGSPCCRWLLGRDLAGP